MKTHKPNESFSEIWLIIGDFVYINIAEMKEKGNFYSGKTLGANIFFLFFLFRAQPPVNLC